MAADRPWLPKSWGEKRARPAPMTAVTIVHAGRRWNGQWYIEADRLGVACAYGSRSVDVRRRRRPPETVAAEILLQLVIAWSEANAKRPRPGSRGR